MYYTIYQRKNGKVSRQLHLTNDTDKVNETVDHNNAQNGNRQSTTVMLNKHMVIRLLKITFGLKPSFSSYYQN